MSRKRPAPAVVLVGFMGAGKTTGARMFASALRARTIDTDKRVEQDVGMTIPQYFGRHGEAAFREVEERVTLEILDKADGDVISLGGGTLGSARVREALARHTVVLLHVSLPTAWRRAKRSSRPLAKDRDAFVARYHERQEVYEQVADVVLPEVDRQLLRTAIPAIRQVRDAKGARLLWAHTDSGGYPVWLRPGLLRDLPPWPLPDGSRRIAVTDEHVAEHHAGRVPGLAGVVEFPAGEAHKTLATCERVWSAFVEQGVTRADHVVAIGGGVVGDLAGFVASTYQRGIPVVQVPTTLVAQVDSAYGGKTGVDLPAAKNYVGAYHQPAAVLVDPDTLETLPPEELAAGYAEVVKTALIAGGALWEQVSSGAPVDPLTVLRCARTKLQVVADDERDGGRRQVLNLGHTVGHAIETVTDYRRYRHGEAVGLGLLAALRLSGQEALRGQVAELLARAGLPTTMDPAIDVGAVHAATAKDKKRLGSEPVPFVVVREPGDVRYGQQMADRDVRSAIAELAG
ncbi:bifunctional shikimate kinase/3-dehydroquinate synthase [Patulibacter sp. SYSU D01012]|uniref:bifunctional shikimate kinase/3-dehydroquinate synthase n=1 Tax=Patulibacter sp. SYSU D01012 TaxID=2817381 RepID=UPI001B304352|nr:bifunctional shikimate kinase/3-dehydroquinate synthase [Patulibacter sp. SYSU D01012]